MSKAYKVPSNRFGLSEDEARELIRRYHAFPQFVPLPAAQPAADELVRLGLLNQDLTLTDKGVRYGKTLTDFAGLEEMGEDMALTRTSAPPAPRASPTA